MRLLIASYGTEGDVRPLVALARRWMAAGHEARLFADAATLDEAWQQGVPSAPLVGDIRGLSRPGRGIARAVGASPRQGLEALKAIANRHAATWLRQILRAGRNADAIVASGLAAFTALSAGEALGIPVLGASFIPLTPTRAFASPFLPDPRWPRGLNIASHHFVNNLIWRGVRDGCNDARQRVAGLPARRTLWRTHPILYGISPTLLPRPSDWPTQVHMCGQWLKPAGIGVLPPALSRFLNSGPPPVYAGFGSMMGFDTRKVWRDLLAACDGRRVIIAPGWAGLGDTAVPENAFVLDSPVPHDALFPRCAAVVHHGGSGTSHSATRAGRPSVVVAFAGDQAFWGRRLHALGVAAPPMHIRRLDASRIARALAFTEDRQVLRRARNLGERMEAEDGTGHAVKLLERLLQTSRVAA